MAFLLDPRWHTDPWVRRISIPAKLAFVLFLTGSFRKRIPGLCFPVAAPQLAAAMGDEVATDVAKTVLDELVLPDRFGVKHVFYDPDHLVLRIPRAPAYNQANGNVLLSWYREWRETPECDLKWQHLESLRAGVNFQNETMARAWGDTFRQPEEAFARGERLRNYVDLADRRSAKSRKRQTEGGNPQDLPDTAPPEEGSLFASRGESGKNPTPGARVTPLPRAIPVPSDPPEAVSQITRVGGGSSTPDPQTAPASHLPATEPGVHGVVAGGVATRGQNAPASPPQASVGRDGTGVVRRFQPPPGVE